MQSNIYLFEKNLNSICICVLLRVFVTVCVFRTFSSNSINLLKNSRAHGDQTLKKA